MDPSLEGEPERFSDLTDAQLSKLGEVSLAWTDTFAANPTINRRGYANLRFVEKKYGKATVRGVFDYCIEQRVSPQGDNAMPITIALCKGWD